MPRPQAPPPEVRPGTLFAHAQIFRYIFRKSFVHFFVRMRKIILTKNTELSTLDLPKRTVGSHTSSYRNTYLSSYTVCSNSTLNTIGLLQQKRRTIQLLAKAVSCAVSVVKRRSCSRRWSRYKLCKKRDNCFCRYSCGYQRPFLVNRL